MSKTLDLFFLFSTEKNFTREKDFVMNLLDNLGFSVFERGYLKMPSTAFSPARKQFNAGLILSYLSQLKKSEVALGITKEDIYFGDLNFVFGLASPTSLLALVSLLRLDPVFYGFPQDEDLYFSRIEKEIIHEIGHVFGLLHCDDPLCVMSFSNSVFDVDRKTKDFCQTCGKNFRRKSV
jgi:archaemetzincin